MSPMFPGFKPALSGESQLPTYVATELESLEQKREASWRSGPDSLSPNFLMRLP